MSRIRSTNTKPEVVVRSVLHSLGYRFRLHRKDLAGKPDIVLPKHNAVIFVHGCFWHRHKNCKFSYVPKTRIDFWQDKFSKNIKRDKYVYQTLHKQGWKTLIVWECQVFDRDSLVKRLHSFLR